MHTSLDSQAEGQSPHQAQAFRQQLAAPRQNPWITISVLIGLLIAALVPRILLALQLDVVTDEIVYIQGGKKYLPLVTNLLHSVGSPDWMYNHEHPPLVKVLIGFSIAINSQLGHPLNELVAARMPSILFGTLLVVVIYLLGRGPFGRVNATLAALCLAFSPWLVYFSALAYLDMTMTSLVTIAYLLLWHAPRRPWLYPVSTLLLGLGAASKYTAALVIPAMALFTGYYFLAIRPKLPVQERPKVPWLWWAIAIIIAPLAFLAVDPAIWPHPYGLLRYSFDYEWRHSINGHLTFLAGRYDTHVPHWAILYIIFTKMSAFITIPAAIFVVFALVKLVRFHLGKAASSIQEATNISFLLIWLISVLAMYSLLNIVVGTHYHLPLAPAVAVAGTTGLYIVLRYCSQFFVRTHNKHPQLSRPASINRREVVVIALLSLLIVVPHLLGLVTIPDAEGYTSELVPDENNALQVAYPGYRDALAWLANHTDKHASVGLVAFNLTLKPLNGVSWFDYNQDYAKRFQLIEAHPDDKTYPYDYVIWPMHLVQRGKTIPPPWNSHVIHVVKGGNTIYCYILAAR